MENQTSGLVEPYDDTDEEEQQLPIDSPYKVPKKKTRRSRMVPVVPGHIERQDDLSQVRRRNA